MPPEQFYVSLAGFLDAFPAHAILLYGLYLAGQLAKMFIERVTPLAEKMVDAWCDKKRASP